MRFWDSSAVVPLVSPEATSSRVRSWLRRDPIMLVSTLTPVEVLSALHRKEREGSLTKRAVASAKRRLKLVASSWSEIVQYDASKDVATALVARHPLRAADSLQLAAAIVARDSLGHPREFVTLDTRLAAAAEKEGFQVLVIGATVEPSLQTQGS